MKRKTPWVPPAQHTTTLLAGDREELVAYPISCMMAVPKQQKDSKFASRDKTQTVTFDSGFFDILIDNCASVSIANQLSYFVNPPTKSNTKIIGINGDSAASLVGTLKWKIEDDDGNIHDIILSNTFYSAGVRNRLLSPQHWSQQ